MDIKKIDSVTISVRDVEAASRFYAEKLGLPEIWRMDERMSRGFGVGDNSATINLEQSRGAAMALIIQVERVDEARRELEAKGVRFDGATETIPDIGMLAPFRDPDGNKLILLDYTIEHARERQSG